MIEHPAIFESAVVASPDKIRGHVVKAYIVLNDQNKKRLQTEKGYSDFLSKDIQDFVKRITAAYKYPRKVSTIIGSFSKVILRIIDLL